MTPMKYRWTIVRDGSPECPWVWHRISPGGLDVRMGCVRHHRDPSELAERSALWDAWIPTLAKAWRFSALSRRF